MFPFLYSYFKLLVFNLLNKKNFYTILKEEEKIEKLKMRILSAEQMSNDGNCFI